MPSNGEIIFYHKWIYNYSDIIYFMLNYFHIIACWPESVLLQIMLNLLINY